MAAGVAAGLLAWATFLTRYTGLLRRRAASGLSDLCGARLASLRPVYRGVPGHGRVGVRDLGVGRNPHFQVTLRTWSSRFGVRRSVRFLCHNLVYVGSQLPWPLVAPLLIGLRGIRGEAVVSPC